jgi:dipeptidyl peptidase IV (DPP IV)-like protein/WD40 repeat protein
MNHPRLTLRGEARSDIDLARALSRRSGQGLTASLISILIVASFTFVVRATDHAAAGTLPGRTGRIALVGADARGDEIFTVNPDGTGLKELTAGESSPTLAPEWSPDGGRIAFARNYDIWVVNANGSGVTNLTKSPGVLDWHPAWSPDGSRIAFASGGAAELHLMDPDGANVVNLGVTAQDPEWSPGGQTIVFSHAGDIFVLDLDTSNATNLTNTTDVYEKDPGWSPDGARIVFAESAAGSSGVAGISLMDTDGGNRVHVTPTTNEDFDPSFSPEGDRIAFSSAYKIFLIDPDGANRTPIVQRLQFPLAPDWQAISVTVTTNVTEVNYREEATVTANLFWAGSTTNPNVAIYRHPFGGNSVLVASGPVDASGNLTTTVTFAKRTTLFAIWEGDGDHPAAKSRGITVIVHALVHGRLRRHYAVNGSYRLYRPGINPRYDAEVIPNHAGKRLYFNLQRRRNGVWRRIVRAGFPIRSDGFVVVFINADLLRIGVPYRIRAEFQRDIDHGAGEDAWRNFKVTAGSRLAKGRAERRPSELLRLSN